MAKLFSLASWNVEHFKGKFRRTDRVVDFLNDQKPDVFSLYEVEGKSVFSALTQRMPGYQFHITEGRQVQEILVGVKRKFTAFFSQRTEFRSGHGHLRPGALLTLTIGGKNYVILFLHMKSMPDPRGFGIRDDQFESAMRLKRVLDKVAGGKGKANMLVVGDLNTMGMKYPFKRSIGAALEIRNIDRRAKLKKMRRLTKDESATFSNGSQSRYPDSDLDHVVASNQLAFRQFSGADVIVRGWPKKKTTASKDRWIRDYSDHALLYLEVQK